MRRAASWRVGMMGRLAEVRRGRAGKLLPGGAVAALGLALLSAAGTAAPAAPRPTIPVREVRQLETGQIRRPASVAFASSPGTFYVAPADRRRAGSSRVALVDAFGGSASSAQLGIRAAGLEDPPRPARRLRRPRPRIRRLEAGLLGARAEQPCDLRVRPGRRASPPPRSHEHSPQ